MSFLWSAYDNIKSFISGNCSPELWKHICKIKRFNWLLPHPLVVDKAPYLQTIELTNACPMHCVACARELYMKRPIGFMDITMFKKIIDELATYWVSVPPSYGKIGLFHFGESLLHPRFDEAMRYIISNGFKCILSCNPLLLTEVRAIKLFSAKPSEVWLMMDGVDDETFFRTRGVKNIYNISLKHTLRAIEIKNSLSPDTDLRVTAIDFPELKEKVDKMETFWRERGATVSRLEYVPWDGTTIKGAYVSTICPFPWRSMSITWDGTVVPCCMDYDKLYPLGNVKDAKLIDIWNSKQMIKFRAELRSGNIKNSLCIQCRNPLHKPGRESKLGVITPKV